MRSKYASLFLILVSFASCASIKKSAIRSLADMLSSPDGAGVFTSDDDPKLIADSMPLALKLYEILLSYDPDNAGLAASTGRNFVMYSGAFVQMPADMLSDEHWREGVAARRRAKKLYRRGRDYLLQSLELRHEGFLHALESGDYDEAMMRLEKEDASSAYWGGLAWLGMAGTDPLDMELSTSLDKALLLLYRAMELEETNPGIHSAMIQIQLSLPSALILTMRERSPNTAAYMDQYYRDVGVSEEARKRAFYHYYRALSLSKNQDPGPHITMATAVSVKEQDAEGFKDYLEKALAIEPDADPETRLMVILYQGRAQWLLENIESFFLDIH